MESVIFKSAERFLFPVQSLMAMFFLLRGHNEPGGGFIAGLIIACAFTLKKMAVGHEANFWLRSFSARRLVQLGWILAFASGIFAVIKSQPYLTAIWGPSIFIPGIGKIKLGTVLLFDFGVFFLVWGMVMGIFFLLIED
ncbi:MAG: Na(+)/H(+) antiporter subunit B [Deltaproteobacteria bacterium]|nr:Na(+)/H(+) antiporter subunit B [Deltaproteobacteria bacterium]